jgi:hypothetical protein
MEELLLDDSPKASYHLDLAKEEARERLHDEEYQEVEEGLKFLSEKWFALSAGTRRACAFCFEDMGFNEERNQEGE